MFIRRARQLQNRAVLLHVCRGAVVVKNEQLETDLSRHSSGLMLYFCLVLCAPLQMHRTRMELFQFRGVAFYFLQLNETTSRSSRCG